MLGEDSSGYVRIGEVRAG